MPKTSKLAPTSVYEKQAQLCGALANPLRLQIIDLLADGERTSTQLLEVLGIPKANLSQHVAVLRDVGIVAARREGAYQVLSLALPLICEACAMVKQVLKEKLETDAREHAELRRELSRAEDEAAPRRKSAAPRSGRATTREKS